MAQYFNTTFEETLRQQVIQQSYHDLLFETEQLKLRIAQKKYDQNKKLEHKKSFSYVLEQITTLVPVLNKIRYRKKAAIKIQALFRGYIERKMKSLLLIRRR